MAGDVLGLEEQPQETTLDFLGQAAPVFSTGKASLPTAGVAPGATAPTTLSGSGSAAPQGAALGSGSAKGGSPISQAQVNIQRALQALGLVSKGAQAVRQGTQPGQVSTLDSIAADNAARAAKGIPEFTESFQDPRFPGINFPSVGSIQNVATSPAVAGIPADQVSGGELALGAEVGAEAVEGATAEGLGIGSPYGAAIGAVSSIPELLDDRISAGQKAVDTAFNVAAGMSGPFGPWVSGVGHMVDQFAYGPGSYVSDRLSTASQMREQIPALFEDIAMAGGDMNVIRDALAALGEGNLGHDLRFKVSVPDDLTSAAFSGGYDVGESAWGTLNPALSELISTELGLGPMAQAGDARARAILDQLRGSAQSSRSAREAAARALSDPTNPDTEAYRQANYSAGGGGGA